VPLLSWFCFFAWQLALAPPWPGEALRAPKLLRECTWYNQVAVCIVLAVEFVQFNALSFNPALGAWLDLPSITEYYSYSFFVFGSSEYRFEQQLWAYCALALGWVVFAIFTLALIAHHRAAEARTASNTAVQSLASLTSFSSTSSLQPLSGGVSVPSAPPVATAAAAELSGSEYTMASPVILVVMTIGRLGVSALRAYGRVLAGLRSNGWHLVYCARALRPACISCLALVPIAPILLLGALGAAASSMVVGLLVASLVALGLAVCGAFAAIALLHFPILMNMLSVLNCQYDEGGQSGHLVRMPSQGCWEGKHWLFAGASVVMLAVLYPVMIIFERKRQSAAEVSYHVRFTACILIGKLALSACSAVLVSTIPAAAYLLVCSAMLIAFLHVNNQREQDEQPACCNVRSVRLLRSCLLTCALWSAVVTLASTVIVAADWWMAAALCALWLLTATYFGLIIAWPDWEPHYQAEVATLAVKLAPRSLPHHHPPPPPSKADSATGGRSPLVKLPIRQQPPPPCGLTGPGTSVAGGTPERLPRALGTPPPAGGIAIVPELLLPRAPSSLDQLEASYGAETDAAVRQVWMAANPAARPRVALYEFDDGFDAASLGAASSAARRADATARGDAVAADAEAEVELADSLLPIVLGATPAAGSLPASRLGVAHGGGYAGHAGSADELHPGDVIISINGEGGLSPRHVLQRLETEPGPLCIGVRRAAWRSAGTKLSRAVSSLPRAPVRIVTQWMMLYPQDASLQRAGCERLCREVVEASERSTLRSLIADVRAAGLLPVVLNAMEVHVRSAPVLHRAARLLTCLANTEGSLRANLVAAGVLPALCAGLRMHEGGAGAGGSNACGVGGAVEVEPSVRCVTALCDLAAELTSARGAVAGSRRALCEALAATSTHRAVLRALRLHVKVEGLVRAACKMLLAYQEEFEGAGGMPPALVHALRSLETLSALELAQRTYAHTTEVQLAAEWARRVGHAARERWLAKGGGTRSSQAEGRRTPHKARRPAADVRPSADIPKPMGELATPGEAAPDELEARAGRAECADTMPTRLMPVTPPAKMAAQEVLREAPRAAAALSPASPRRALQALQPTAGGAPSSRSAPKQSSKNFKAE